MATLIMTAKLNDVDPLAWLADVLARIAEYPAHGSINCCHGIGTPVIGRPIRQLEPKLTGTRPSPDVTLKRRSEVPIR
jgi:hypothetical protein